MCMLISRITSFTENFITRKFISIILITAIIFGLYPLRAVRAEASGGSVVPASDTELQKKDGRPQYVQGEVIVKYKRGIKAAGKLSLKSQLALTKQEDIPLTSGAELVKINDGASVENVVASLKASGQVEYAQPNYIYYPSDVTPVDELYGEQWGLNNIGQTINHTAAGTPNVDIDAPQAWDYTGGLEEVVVAVIDTGVDINHPELAGKIWTNSGEIPGNGLDDDENGYVDDVQGWDFVHGDNSVYDTSVEDNHGTHVAGIITAAANTSGIAGVAPNVKIMPLKFMDDISGSSIDAINAINYANSKGVKICNNSWGGGGDDPVLELAIENSGMLFVAAAGNEANNNDTTPAYPASFSSSNILSVAAVDYDGNLAWFSNYGATSVDIGAPGGYILSTYPESTYAYLSGTSMAAPYVTGVAAVLMGQKNLTVENTIDLIKATGKDLSLLSGKTSTGRMVNLYNPVATQVGQPIVTLGSLVASNASSYNITFNTGSYGKLISAEDDISITFPTGTILPATISADKITLNGTLVGTNSNDIVTSGQTVTFNTPITIGHNSLVNIVINKTANIRNPSVAGQQILTVETSVDPIPKDSSGYVMVNTPVWSVGSSLTASNVNETSLDLSWTPAEDDLGIVAYKVYSNDILLGSVAGSVYNVSGLLPKTLYTFSVQAGDGDGNWNANGPTAIVSTIDNSAPTWSEGNAVTATNIGNTSLTLNWTAAEDNISVNSYKVYKDGVEFATVSGAVHSCDFVGLSSETEYTFKVEAGDASGNWSTDGPLLTVTTSSLPSLPAGSPSGAAPSIIVAVEPIEQTPDKAGKDINELAQKTSISSEDVGKAVDAAGIIIDSLKNDKLSGSESAAVVSTAAGTIGDLAKIISKAADKTAVGTVEAKALEIIDAISAKIALVKDETDTTTALAGAATAMKNSASLAAAVKDEITQRAIIEKAKHILEASALALENVSPEKAIEAVQNMIKGAARIAAVDKDEISAEEIVKGIVKATEKVLEKSGKEMVVPETNGGIAKVSITDTMANDILSKADAVVAAIKQLETRMKENNIEKKIEAKITIEAATQKEINSVETILPAALMETMKTKGIEKVELSTGLASFTIEPDAINTNDTTAISLTVSKADNAALTDEQKAVAGNSLVYDFNAAVVKKDGMQEKISSFSKQVEIRVPYLLTEGEDTEKITVFFVNDKGELENKSGRYDPESKTVIFTTEHFSKYIVRQNSVSFNDIGSSAWAIKYIEVMAAKGIVKGVTAGRFEPEGTVTRAEFAAMLARTFKIEDTTAVYDFKDVKTDSWYYRIVVSAVKAGMIKGYEDNTFRPDEKISRQDMAVMVARAVKAYKGSTVQGDVGKYLNFTDAAKVQDYARDSVSLAVKYGIINGKPGGLFDPQSNATRAEAVKLMYVVYGM